MSFINNHQSKTLVLKILDPSHTFRCEQTFRPCHRILLQILPLHMVPVDPLLGPHHPLGHLALARLLLQDVSKFNVFANKSIQKSLPELYSRVLRTRQKGLQSNSGPMCLFVFICWHRGEAIVNWSPPAEESYSGELLTAAGHCKNVVSYSWH